MKTSFDHSGMTQDTDANLSRTLSFHELRPAQDFVSYLQAYARQKPDVAALWCLGIGIIVGWKAKPW
ncbi:MAG: hypothetical protein KDA81_02085 [Planctomycetaceae bacterium]|nr:hypothetical protein [Planctomycetaceae bacterium]